MSLGGLALDFALGESVLEPLMCHLVLGLVEHVDLVESGTGAGGVATMASGARASAVSGVSTVAEVT